MEGVLLCNFVHFTVKSGLPRSRRYVSTPHHTDGGYGCTRTSRSTAWDTNCGGIDKTSHICRFSHTRVNPPRFGLCNFMQFYAFLVRSAAKCWDEFQNGRRESAGAALFTLTG